MLQVGKEQLARRMYETWCASAKRTRLWRPDTPVWAWERIGDTQRQCWLDAAEAAARLLVEAMAASPA